MVSNKISGWYYDLQLENILTSVSLHPNRVLSKDQSKWEAVSNPDPDFTINVDGVDVSYSYTPICRAIINEDFNVSVANSWSDFGGDMLSQMWESIKPLAPYADAAKKMIRSAVEDYRNPNNKELVDKINESSVSRTLAELMIAADDAMNNPDSGIDITDYLNRALVVQGTRFSYYSGSGTSFGNLMMKFTLFPTYDNDGNYLTVDAQVEKLFPYCIGKYVSGTDGLDVKNEEMQKQIDKMIGWQKPPGGFRANVKNVDVVQEGTLLLKFGPYYSITNLVVENATFNFSKQMTKNPNPDTKAGETIISPLYCDVTIQLRPATKYSDESLKNFVLGRSNSARIQSLSDEMQWRLDPSMNGISRNGSDRTLYVY